MAIPEGGFLVGTGLAMPPDAAGRPVRTVDYERGGVAIGDPSQGLDAHDWRIRLSGNDLLASRAPYTTEQLLFSEAGITECSLSFDQNMRPVVAYVASGVAKLWWFDTVAEAQVTTAIGAGVKSPYLTHDDKRDLMVSSGLSDVLLFYIIGNRLCVRTQRERYAVERTLRWLEGGAASIRSAGMGPDRRIRVELAGLKSRVIARPFLSAFGAPVYAVNPASSISLPVPTGIQAGDAVFIAVVRRIAASPGAGWTLVREVSFSSPTAQTLSVWRLNAGAPLGSSVTVSQSTYNILAGMLFAVRAEAGQVALVEHASSVVNSTSTNSIAPPSLAATGAGGELHIAIGSTVNTQAGSGAPAAPGLATLISGAAPDCRLAVAYQLRDLGQPITGSFTFDNGTPSQNGLGAITMRFGTT